MTTRVFAFTLLVCWCVLFVERPAFAYLDPGSGSMLLQILLGGLAGVAVAGKMYWHRIKAKFSSGGKKPE
jgi:hypothetical protein